MRFRTSRIFVASLTSCALLAACGSSKKASSPTTAAGAATTAASSGVTTAASSSASGSATSAAAATTAPSSAGGIVFSTTNAHKATVDRSGQTIKIGLSNDEAGSFSLPEFRIGAEVGAKYVNDHGGVNGAKIELTECTSDASPEGAVNCANQFVEKKVDIASYGIEVAIDAGLPVYDGANIPLVTPAAYGSKQRTDPNAFSFGSSAGAYTVWPLLAFKSLNASKLAFIVEDQPSAHNFVDLLNKWAPKLGVTVLSSTFLDPSKPDYTAAVQAGMTKNADVIWAFVSEPGCIAFAQAVAQLAFKGVAMAGACSQYIQAVGKASVGTLNLIDTYYPDSVSFAPPNIQANMKTYSDAMHAAGQDKYINGFATLSFSFMQDLKSYLETIPAGTPINAASVKQALSAGITVPGFNGPDITCGAKVWPAEPAYCRAGLQILKVVDKNGTLTREPLSTKDYGYFYDPAIAAQSASL